MSTVMQFLEVIFQPVVYLFCVANLAVMVNTYGTGKLADEDLAKLVRKVFPLSPHGIIDHLNLREPVYRNTAAYGHFGRSEFAWEKADATDELLAGARNK